jgi:hypothetical protein
MSNTFLKFAKYQVSQVHARVSGHTLLSVCIRNLEEAKTAHQLTKAIKKIQSSLWKLSSDERRQASQRVTDVLSQHVLTASDASLRLVAADWLRFLLQEGVVAQPEKVFVALVTAALQASRGDTQESAHELRIYLKLIFESLWPFRSPYSAYPHGLFHSNEMFCSLFPLLKHIDADVQQLLLNIFTQLPMLDVYEILEFLPPQVPGESIRAGP